MMEALDVLRGLLIGDPAAARALLHTCRVEAYGAETFGPSTAIELFARRPAPLGPQPHVIRAAASLLVMDADGDGREQALVADLYDGRIGRVWRVGPGEADEIAEPGIAVAADPFLSQLKDDVGCAPSDHPELDPAALPAVLAVGRRVAHGGPEGGSVAQGRAFLIRAFSEGDRAGAIWSLSQDVGAVSRTCRNLYAAAALRVRDGAVVHERVVMDAAPAPTPLPRF